MFQNREFRIRMVKTNKAQDVVETIEQPRIDPEQINEIAKDFVRDAAKVVVGVMAVSFVLTVTSEIIIRSLTNDK